MTKYTFLKKLAIASGIVTIAGMLLDYAVLPQVRHMAEFGTVSSPKYSIMLSRDRNKYGSLEKTIEDYDPQEKAKEIFKELTGKDFPKEYKIEFEYLPDNVGGMHKCIDKKIIINKKIKDIDQLLKTYLHEMGHVVAQHSEYSKKAKEDIRILEEACAYAFENAGTSNLYNNDPDLAERINDIWKRDLPYFISEDKGSHKTGAVVFIAANAVLKDHYKTFNYLATLKNSDLDNLDEDIKRKVKEYVNDTTKLSVDLHVLARSKLIQAIYSGLIDR